LIVIVKIASNASSVFDKKAITPHKPEPRMKMHYCNLRLLAQNKRPLMKKRQLQNARGSKQKSSDEKRGNLKMQGAQNKRLLMKKEATQNARGSKQKTSYKKRGNPKT
jgi:hypothetical protein